jgi:hypothetical protein
MCFFSCAAAVDVVAPPLKLDEFIGNCLSALSQGNRFGELSSLASAIDKHARSGTITELPLELLQQLLKQLDSTIKRGQDVQLIRPPIEVNNDTETVLESLQAANLALAVMNVSSLKQNFFSEEVSERKHVDARHFWQRLTNVHTFHTNKQMTGEILALTLNQLCKNLFPLFDDAASVLMNVNSNASITEQELADIEGPLKSSVKSEKRQSKRTK